MTRQKQDANFIAAWSAIAAILIILGVLLFAPH